ncbi:hypothetical protein A3194_08120 [Candidatus Thiodiazotropha endoloripes]|uniref:hypothetical protein n=1 Tax=Candidatus Thiodiazotropha endoloripes TaxID=1818881 RepID=UPI00083E28A9|nr:hypothetical protein [Candidatus Thiodiazotropha endoloripes]MCG7872393.1 hypothetical protein [Candidatus Thiodiazotropha lotti]ODB92345.1 hypothetical protein A3194_08120 [Candidatus Thiodiazotropha endoloripes]
MFEMQGLRAENTQGWMAAIGVISILDRMGMDVQIAWNNTCPTIHGADENQVIGALEEYLKQGSDILDRLPKGINGDKTALDLTAGRVSLTGVIESMINTVNRVNIVEALTQVWKNQDNITTLGWDSVSVKFAASVGGNKAPDSSPHRGVLAGQWLAAESLPITGVGPRTRKYKWVTWSVPLDLGGVRAVVQSTSTDWGGTLYIANVGRNGKMGYLEPALTMSNHNTSGG